MNSINIIDVLHSIQDVRLDSEGQLEVKFKLSDLTWVDGWEPISGYIHGSFTEQLLLLIEDSLLGKLHSDAPAPSPNGRYINKVNSMSKLKTDLIARKNQIETQLKEYHSMLVELADVNKALAALEPTKCDDRCLGCSMCCP